jgi:subtilisin family serine protease
MSTSTTERLFATTNLDPALAEAVEAAPADRILEGIIRLEDPGQVPAGFRVVSRFHRICTGRFAAALTWTIRQHPNVISLKASRPLGLHDDGLRSLDPFDNQSRTRADTKPLPFRGHGCIVAALDFGLDFAHPNFLNPDGTTRLLAFWDQGAGYDAAHPNRFGYGRQYTPAEINAALATADPYRALGYGPQPSDSGKGSHGTHTLDIAAGNGRAAGSRPGAASEAGLIFVHLSTRRLGTSENLGDSVRLLEALDWVNETARGRPWVVNLSVGSTAGSHDGTSLVEQGMHELLRARDGGAICQSGGNYRSADLAVHGRLEDGEHRDLSWIIDPADTTPNELDAWYSGQDRFIVALRPPQGADLGADILRVRLGEVAAITHGGAVVGRLYHRKNDPNNGDNHVEIFLYPNAPPGTWTLRLSGDYVINGRYHAWIERDLAKPGAQSRFDPGIASSAYTLGTIATSPLVITVGAYDGHADDAPVAPFSSCGPTRDERRDKPELLAPGVDVRAARSIPRGAVRQEGLLVERSGTSMAAPHVTGLVAALFEAAGGRPVSIDVIRECLKRSATPHLHADDGNCCAWGRLDAAAAIRAMLAWAKPEPAAATQWTVSAELASAGVPTAEVPTTEEAQMVDVRIVVVDEKGQALVNGRYVATQGTTREAGAFAAGGNGLAVLKSIDPAQPFVFEVSDRACAIQAGAFIDPGDSAIEYGGTWFDWTLVRDDDQPDSKFWPHYRRELDLAAGIDLAQTAKGRRVDRFLQHEHLVRRPLRLTKAARAGTESVRLVAHPTRLRAGPLLRYADHERAVVWLETVTPAMIRVTCKAASGGSPSPHCASTVRVGGRYFAAVEITGLQPETFYSYTLELAPLPGAGAIPVASQAINDVFPALTGPVVAATKAQLKPVSLDGSEWLAFRTLRRTYERRLRFATGSCRWYPGDLSGGKDWGPDMMVGLGRWLIANRNSRQKWPDFLFLSGDQIYADEIGDDHGDMLVQGRFAARVPGPIDAAPDVRNKLVDGAWAGRFSHRFKAYREPDKALLDRVKADFKKLGELDRKFPEIRDFYLRYAKSALTDKEERELSYLLMRMLVFSLGGKITDQKVYDEARELLHTVETLNLRSGSYRAFLPHWTAGSDAGLRRNPMVRRFLAHNFLLWDLPIFEALLPRVIDSSNMAFVQPTFRGHLPAGEGRHAGDFAEYAYLHERAWAGSPEVRQLLSHIPTFMMLDDHETTDDWNFGVSWVRMLHNSKDAFRLWPKTLTDGLAAYWMYQGWCNKAPSQWRSDDPRVKSLLDAQRTGRDALPDLRRCIHAACFMQVPSGAENATFQTGLSLDWHYQLPFDPPFLVPDCRTRKFLVSTDEGLRVIDHDDPKKRPLSQTIDSTQLEWMRRILVKPGGPSVAFLGLSTPFLIQDKVMGIMTRPETTAQAWDQARRAALGLPELPALTSAAASSTLLTSASNALLRIFRRAKDLEHMIRDKSWRDLWDVVASMQQAGSRTKTLVLVSGDVHHNYCMTANLAERGRPQPELLQVTCSGFQTTIRSSFDKWLAQQLGNQSFNVGKRRLVPGFMFKRGTNTPDLALFQNAAALVEVSMAPEVNVQVTYLSGADEYVYLYTSGAAYLRDGEPIDSPWQKGRPRLVVQGNRDGEAVPPMTNVAPPAQRDRALAREGVTS